MTLVRVHMNSIDIAYRADTSTVTHADTSHRVPSFQQLASRPVSIGVLGVEGEGESKTMNLVVINVDITTEVSLITTVEIAT